MIVPPEVHDARQGLPQLLPGLFLSAVALFSGAAVMVIELAGTRILAPWFGNSLYTWTGLIGVILVSMGCGYYIGGMIADKWPQYVVLAHLIAGAGIFTLAIPFLYPVLERNIGMMHFISGPVVASLMLFAIPGCLLAAVSPFAVKLMSLLTCNRKIGLSSGNVSMCAALGSVIGTFGAGFWLIPNLQLRMLFLIIGLMLGLFALAGYGLFAEPRQRRAGLVTGVFLIFGGVVVALFFWQTPEAAGTLYDHTSCYQRIRVIENQTRTGDTRRLILLDLTTEGGQYVNSRELPIRYQKFWELTKVFCPGLKSALFLGGGGFGMPEALHDAFPQAAIDVIELDPMVIEVGRRFFRTEQYPRMQVSAGDARKYLRHHNRQYDFIFGDVFNGVHTIPAHLVTIEFFQEIKRHLTDRGLYMMNIISAVEGDKSTIFHAVANTMRQVFDHMEVFTLSPGSPAQLQTLLVLTAKKEIPINSLKITSSLSPATQETFLNSYLRPDQYAASTQVVLTDEFNPVEYMVASARRE